MPKKFKGENSKASEARARKQAQKDEENTRKQQAADDEFWRDDDKHVNKKLQRKDDKEKKKQEQVEKKLELRKLHDEEMDSIKAKSVSGASQPAKLTRAQIDQQREQEERRQRAAAASAGSSKAGSVTEGEDLLVENVNRLTVDGDEARTVDEALTVLSQSESEKIDMHPEKRMKAAFAKFEEENLPILKRENPNMRLSQLKQMLKKQWMKSPDNPLNQRLAQMNSK